MKKEEKVIPCPPEIRQEILKITDNDKGIDQYFDEFIEFPYLGPPYFYLYYLKSLLNQHYGCLSPDNDVIVMMISRLCKETLKKIKEIEEFIEKLKAIG